MVPESGMWWQRKEAWINDEGGRQVWKEIYLLICLSLRVISSMFASGHRRERLL